MPHRRLTQSAAVLAAAILSPSLYSAPAQTESAVFAGGCFWGIEAVFEHTRGVVSAVSGYTGGTLENPTYGDVTTETTGHAESVAVTYDPAEVTYEQLLEVFFAVHDPTQLNRQGPDVGTSYRSAIFPSSPQQRSAAYKYIATLNASGKYRKKIVTTVETLGRFYAAEGYHQNYLAHHSNEPYIVYNDLPKLDHLKKTFPALWRETTTETRVTDQTKHKGTDPKNLTPIQYEVTQNAGTERPFQNEYWDNHEPGIYVDVVSGEPLFSSFDKFDSGTGWPSFTKPLIPQNVKNITDRSLGMTRVEVRSAGANSHLGHLFDDGPEPTGQRYCMNSASMRFIPAAKLAEEGYAEFAKLFAKR